VHLILPVLLAIELALFCQTCDRHFKFEDLTKTAIAMESDRYSFGQTHTSSDFCICPMAWIALDRQKFIIGLYTYTTLISCFSFSTLERRRKQKVWAIASNRVWLYAYALSTSQATQVTECETSYPMWKSVIETSSGVK